jgi:hypothetical protein
MQTTTNPLETIYLALGIERDEDKLKEELPKDARLLTIGVWERDGEKLVWLERSFKDEEELRATLAAQAANPDDPNPLPAAVAKISQVSDSETQIELKSLDYNPVTGLVLGEEAYAFISSGDEDEDRNAGDAFLEDLFYPR